jgi:hypothetical protein
MARLNLDRRSSTLDSLYRGRTPLEGSASDKENQMPDTQDASMGPPKASLVVHPSKRRRLENARDQTPMGQFLTQNPKQTDEDESTRWYNPDQPESERRMLRMEMYRVGREVTGICCQPRVALWTNIVQIFEKISLTATPRRPSNTWIIKTN